LFFACIFRTPLITPRVARKKKLGPTKSGRAVCFFENERSDAVALAPGDQTGSPLLMRRV
jgi:hypothetical protein